MKLFLITGIIVLLLITLQTGVTWGITEAIYTLLTGVGLAFFGYLIIYGYRGMKGYGTTYRKRPPA